MPGEFRGADVWGEQARPQKTSGTATLALGAGVLSFVCFFGLGGVLAIALGWIAHSEIERSAGRLTGKGLANAGIGLGITNVIASVVAVGVFVALAVRADPAPLATRPPPPSPALTTPLSPPRPVPTRAPAEAVEAEPSLPVLPARVGKITIVEAAASPSALDAQLQLQLKESASAGEQVLLWTVTADCEPCAAVGRALADARMQKALANVRLVRADAAAFPVELRRIGVPIDTVPGFTLLDQKGRATDHIHGGEWDADIPANIAPILDKFVRHTFVSRRHPWARPLRDGETPL